MALYQELGAGLSEEDLALREHFHRFAEEVLRPSAMALDGLSPEEAIAEGSVYWDVWRQIKEMGLHRQGMPEHLGGVTLTPIQGCIVWEELSWGSIDWAVAFGAGSLPFTFAATLGNERLIKEFVVPYLEDKEGKHIGCWPITEPAHGGHDAMLAAMAGSGISFDMLARRDGDEWVLRGQKAAWVSNGTVATHGLVMMSAEDQDGGEPGFGIAFVPLDLPGISRGKPLDKIGQRALNQGEIYFDDVRIPADQMIVIPRREGGAGALGAMGNPNAGLGMAFVGVARAAFEETLEYCKQRVQGGKPLIEHQLIQRKLFDMLTKVETARAYARAVMLYNASNPMGLGYYSNASKVYATQVAFEIASEGVQLHGGMGLSKGMLIEKLFRDARAGLIEDGANDSLALMAAPGMISSYAY
jgi:alkylation response protein AidB-like acyl-CoA dehydrogenase